MPLVIPDDLLTHANLTEQEARVEIACRLYDAGKLHKAPAARFAGLDRMAFDTTLRERGLPVIRYTEEDFEQDMATLRELRRTRDAG